MSPRRRVSCWRFWTNGSRYPSALTNCCDDETSPNNGRMFSIEKRCQSAFGAAQQSSSTVMAKPASSVARAALDDKVGHNASKHEMAYSALHQPRHQAGVEERIDALLGDDVLAALRGHHLGKLGSERAEDRGLIGLHFGDARRDAERVKIV